MICVRHYTKRLPTTPGIKIPGRLQACLLSLLMLPAVAVSTPLIDAEPPTTDQWLPGFAIRYLVRIQDTPQMLPQRETVQVSLPTGGWLKPDASDLRVVNATHTQVPAVVISHDPRGNTLLQFTRQGTNRWYWIYAVNPSAEPLVDSAMIAKMSQARQASQQETIKTMKLRVESAQAAGTLRDTQAQLQREQETLDKVEKEIQRVPEWIADRKQELAEATKAVAPLPARVAAAKAPLAAAEKKAQTAQEAVKAAAEQEAQADAEVAAAEKKAQEADAEAAAAEKKAQEADAEATAAEKKAQEADAKANAAEEKPKEPDVKAATEEVAKEAAAAQAAKITAAAQVAKAAAAKIAAEQAVKVASEKAAAAKQAREAAEKAALPLRMALAGVKTKLATEEQALKTAQSKVNRAQSRIKQGEKQLADAQALKQKTQAAITKMTPQVEKLRQASEKLSAQVVASAALSEKLEAAYRQLALDADPRLHREGFALEVRDWGGDQLDELNDWPTVVAGLQRSDNVLGNALITDVLQKMNPYRLGDNLNFAASYRGFLEIKEAGLYRFVLNSDDASFLFINDYLVLSRVGSNRPFRGRIGVYSVGADIELSEGIYPLEIHQVTGNTPGAIGRCAFYWITPKSKGWQRVPSSAFRSALMALPVRVEAPQGVTVPIPSMAVANSLNISGSDLFLTRFEVGGAAPGQKISWDFGDGQSGLGPKIEHLYFAPGDYEVALQAYPGLPPFKRRLHVWPAPVPTSPLALGDAVRALEQVDLDEVALPQLALAFAFLRQSGQIERWPLVEAVTTRLLRQPLQDLHFRIQLKLSLMEALAQQGRSADALKIGEKALTAAQSMRALTIDVQMKLAEIHHRQLQDFDTAAQLYATIVDQNRRLNPESVRDTAIAWGDMYLKMGDVSRASSTYRLADALGRPAGQQASVADASKRGGLLRTAETLLRDGNIRQSRQILERIEQEYPEQKVGGLFRFLRAEADRDSGFYNEAIYNYEVLLRMSQWAGYHSQAMSGLAESHYRLDNFDESIKWLDVIKESDAPFYEKHTLDNFASIVTNGLAAKQSGLLAQARLERNLSFDQANVQGAPPYLLLESPTYVTNALTFQRLATPTSRFEVTFDVPHLLSEGAYWLEFWFRNEATDSHAIPVPRIEVRWEDSSIPPQTVSVIRTFGLDFIGATRLQAPMANQGQITLRFDWWHGLQQIHGLRLRPVTARQEEALLNFMEGRDTP